jgi:hypothetical protein
MTSAFHRKNRVTAGKSYTCKKCSKLWNIAIYKINGEEVMVYNPNVKVFGRRAGNCYCGVEFDLPSIHINKLKDMHSKSKHQRVVE